MSSDTSQARPGQGGNIITGTLPALGLVVELCLTTGYGIAINGYNSPPSGPGGETGRQWSDSWRVINCYGGNTLTDY